jgi:glycosyltransferase involved in cell wall biosynthesis
MKIVIHDCPGHPFQVQLSRSLAKKGYEVIHIYSCLEKTKGNLVKSKTDPLSFNIIGIQISQQYKKYSFIKRRFQEIEYGKLLAAEIIKIKPDVVISSNNPLDSQMLLIKACEANNIKFIFWLQDIYSIAIKKVLKQKFFFLGSIIGNYYISKEIKMLKKSQAVIAITEDFEPILKKWGIKNDKIYIMPNWATLDELPRIPKINEWSLNNSLSNKIVLLYSGTLGFKHNPSILLELAKKYRNNHLIVVVIISEGPAINWLKRESNSLNLNNILFFDFLPYEKLPYINGTADILISILEPSAGIYSVPSKVLTYLCAGRPILLSVPKENLISKIVTTSNSGFVANPSDIFDFLNKSSILINDRLLSTKMGNNARNYAEKYFDINTITKHFEYIINNIGD